MIKKHVNRLFVSRQEIRQHRVDDRRERFSSILQKRNDAVLVELSKRLDILSVDGGQNEQDKIAKGQQEHQR